MADDAEHFRNYETYRDAHPGGPLINPSGDDPVATLMPLAEGNPDRWLAVGRQLAARYKDMTPENAIASVRADLEAGRL